MLFPLTIWKFSIAQELLSIGKFRELPVNYASAATTSIEILIFLFQTAKHTAQIRNACSGAEEQLAKFPIALQNRLTAANKRLMVYTKHCFECRLVDITEVTIECGCIH